MKINNMGRMVDLLFHDEVYKTSIKNVMALLDSKSVKDITLYNKILFSSKHSYIPVKDISNSIILH